MKKQTLDTINKSLLGALLIFVILGLYFTISIPLKEAPEPIPPKEITLTLIGTDCADCTNITALVEFVKKQPNVEVKEIKEVSTADATELIAKYELTKLPTMMITGDNITIENFNQKEDALIFTQTPAPYYDIADKRVKGLLTLTQIKDATCTDCFDTNQILNQLKQAGVKIVNTQTLDIKDPDAIELINKYKIEKIPTIIFDKEALNYDLFAQVWEQVGTTEEDGSLVLRQVSPPYLNTKTKQIEGKVTLTYLSDTACVECFNETIYKQIIVQTFPMHVEKEETNDAESTKGKFLIKKYNITSLPTIIVSKEAASYPNFNTAWAQVGTTEKDGAYVFRNVALLENIFKQAGQKFAYKDLTTRTIKPQQIQAEITPPDAEDS